MPTPNTADAMKRYKAGKAGFTDKSHLKAKGLIPRADGTKRKSPKYEKVDEGLTGAAAGAGAVAAACTAFIHMLQGTCLRRWRSWGAHAHFTSWKTSSGTPLAQHARGRHPCVPSFGPRRRK